ncbi:hypothetical protein C7271_05005 [filamentous cyanobacterium CCP5]|nr:hypothetical protein C7271_05005 [filamentous cyanobacterium CCP5]
MPKENFGRQGMSAKPNTNAEGSLDVAADPVDPNAVAPTNHAASRAEDAPDNPKATERPDDSEAS